MCITSPHGSLGDCDCVLSPTLSHLEAAENHRELRTLYPTADVLLFVKSLSFILADYQQIGGDSRVSCTRGHRDMEDCFFTGHGCKAGGECRYINPLRIIKASKDRDDTLHIELEKKLRLNPDMEVKCHKSCVSSYTSSHHIQRSRKRHGQTERSFSEPLTRKRRSDHF
ncbi:hypothetical protein GWK47_003608 [Chionoecetes opilio]|uniref:Uncharacterized protein n=1 Tax=Chionoecetes opilio TaxID=41210 RepID=A0A8J5D461_CHIOP|nr:hypothetical protein GWK47_003608 [Chionoecetes opilio]